ncbi:MAG: CCC motif membrane protein [Flavobacteriales bacterium]|nr:CCC motif membrane protein [Flavobacteriales bacterium]MCX7768695.1 CCC motif membrane protein [Flavobacteriales bacterium]MDW8410106.1 CCC motif membrane protein [Flavobacteriales bacterium]
MSETPVQQSLRLPNDSAILVLGIFSIFFCCFFGIPGLASGIAALVLANKARNEYKLTPAAYDPESYSQVNTGRICAIVGVVLSCLVLIYYAASVFMALSDPKFFQYLQQLQK